MYFCSITSTFYNISIALCTFQYIKTVGWPGSDPGIGSIYIKVFNLIAYVHLQYLIALPMLIILQCSIVFQTTVALTVQCTRTVGWPGSILALGGESSSWSYKVWSSSASYS